MEDSELTPSNAGPLHPLSLSQREVWLDQLAWPGSPHLNIGGVLDLVGPVNLDCLQESLNLLVAENEALRLVPKQDGKQSLLSKFTSTLEYSDLSHEADPIKAVINWENAWIRLPFELDKKPPWRFAVLKAGDNHHFILIQFHHIIMDGWGTTQIIERWSQLYNAQERGSPPPQKDDPGYLRFITESLEYKASETFRKDAEYWQASIPLLPEPMFDIRYASGSKHDVPDAHLLKHLIPRSDYNNLEATANKNNETTYHWFLAALAIYFAKSLNRTEVVIAAPTLGRNGKKYKTTLGMFVGVMLLRIKVSPGMRVSELISSITALLRSAYRHTRYPLSALGHSLQSINQGRERLFDVLLSYERQDYACVFGKAEGVGSRQTFSGKARYPLGLTVCEFHKTQDVELVFEASRGHFSAHEIELLGPRLTHILSAMQANPDCLLGELPLLPPKERWGLIEGVHIDLATHTQVVPFIKLFEHEADLNPHTPALFWDDEKISYGALDNRANQLAQRLCTEFNAQPGDIIAFALGRGPNMVMALLAIAKTGAAFLPLDIEAPVARLNGILEDSQATTVIIETSNAGHFSELSAPKQFTLPPFENSDLELRTGTSLQKNAPQPGDLAYVLFTSGTTGKPKGVMIEHAALSRRLGWIARTWSITNQDRSALSTQITFDPALIELLVPLTHGGSVALPPPGRLLPESLAPFAVKHAVTLMAFVPSTLSRFLDGLAGRQDIKLRVACCGGEVLSQALSERFSRETGAKLYNVYGPTEATIFATAWPCGPSNGLLALPIGAPLDDTRIYVLNQEYEPVQFGLVGDIFIGGGCLARGYLNRPDLDEIAFAPDPFLQGERIYRTGDRGWLSPDGLLHFAGRADRQIKLRGYRIELSEIESAMLSIESIRQAAVKIVDTDGKQAIHAWAASDQNLSAEELRHKLADRLPDYMLPSRYSLQPVLPLTDTGKVDYSTLPVIEGTLHKMPLRPPHGELEIKLLKIWAEALNRPNLSVHDNFFDQGGDSLAGVAILAGIEEQLQHKLSLHQLLTFPTVASLASSLAIDMGEPDIMISLGTTTRAATLFLAASGHGDLIRFRALAKAMEGACDLHMLQPPGTETDINLLELAQLYADRIEAHGDQNIYLAGFSVGGLAALETSRLLRQNGVAVQELFLVDTVLAKLPPGGFWLWRALAWFSRNLPLLDFAVNGRKLATTLNDPGLYAQVKAMNNYKTVPYDGKTMLIKSSGLTHWDRWLFAPWRSLMGNNLMEQEMRGLHGTLFEPGQIENLARILASRIPPP